MKFEQISKEQLNYKFTIKDVNGYYNNCKIHVMHDYCETQTIISSKHYKFVPF